MTNEDEEPQCKPPLAQAVKAARGEMSQGKLARLAGVDAGQISMIESGKRPDPQFSTVVKIARALGISLDRLADEVHKQDSAPGQVLPGARLVGPIADPVTANWIGRIVDRLGKAEGRLLEAERVDAYLNAKIRATQHLFDLQFRLIRTLAQQIDVAIGPEIDSALAELQSELPGLERISVDETTVVDLIGAPARKTRPRP